MAAFMGFNDVEEEEYATMETDGIDTATSIQQVGCTALCIGKCT